MERSKNVVEKLTYSQTEFCKLLGIEGKIEYVRKKYSGHLFSEDVIEVEVSIPGGK